MRITSSSISSSDAEAGAHPARTWRGFAIGLLAVAAAGYAMLAAGLVALDPYDTGRFALVRKPGVAAQGPRTADASRGRDPAFDGAVIGNSHVQLLSPAELGRRTGLEVVSIAIPGTGPREQMLLLDYFVRHRTRPARAVVLGLDGFWCTRDEALAPWNPFPFWLYDRSAWRYVAGLARFQTFDDAVRRIQYVAGFGRNRRARPDGYWNYDEGLVWRRERHGGFWESGRAPSTIRNESGRFPALEALAAALDRLPAGVALVLLRPPVSAPVLPEPGSDLDRSERACRDAMARLAAGRPSAALVDWRVDRPELHEPENFIDPTHYRSAVARLVEADVAAALRRLSARPGGPPPAAPR